MGNNSRDKPVKTEQVKTMRDRQGARERSKGKGRVRIGVTMVTYNRDFVGSEKC